MEVSDQPHSPPQVMFAERDQPETAITDVLLVEYVITMMEIWHKYVQAAICKHKLVLSPQVVLCIVCLSNLYCEYHFASKQRLLTLSLRRVTTAFDKGAHILHVRNVYYQGRAQKNHISNRGVTRPMNAQIPCPPTTWPKKECFNQYQ